MTRRRSHPRRSRRPRQRRRCDQAPEPVATPTKADEQPDLTPEELIAALEASFRDFKDGDIVEGEVVKIDRDEVLLDIGYKSEGRDPFEGAVDPPRRRPQPGREGRGPDRSPRAPEGGQGGPADPVEEAGAVRACLGPDRRDHAFRPDHHGTRDRGREGWPDPRHRPARVPPGIARRSAAGPRPPAVRRPGARGEDHRAGPQPQQRRAVAPRVPRGVAVRGPQEVPARTSRRASGARARSARS